MGAYTTYTLDEETMQMLIDDILTTRTGKRANPGVAMALQLEAYIGMRIDDILSLKRSSFVKDAGGGYRLDFIEEKTDKKRTFTVPLNIYEAIFDYCEEQGIKKDEYLFPNRYNYTDKRYATAGQKHMSPRTVQKILKNSVDYLGLDDKISTHSFRKYYATSIYNNSNYDLKTVQEALQHANIRTTERYIGVSRQKVNNAIESHCAGKSIQFHKKAAE